MAMRFTHVLLPITLLLVAGAAAADSANDRYQQCVGMMKTDPQGAYYQALAWHSQGGGSGAEHCGALALVQLGRYTEAAPKLDAIADLLGVEVGTVKVRMHRAVKELREIFLRLNENKSWNTTRSIPSCPTA